MLWIPKTKWARYATLRAFVLGVVFLAATGSHAASDKRIEFSTFEPCPTGNLAVARPTVAWKIVPHGEAQVTGVTLFINNKPVDARYDAAKKAVWYAPTQGFGAGKYAVHCEVTLDKQYPVAKDWSFTVAANAPDAPSAPTSQQMATFEAINSVRRELSLPLLSMDSRLCAAAQGHSVYIAANRRVGHTEQNGASNYSGGQTAERVASQGYAGGCFEIISHGAASSGAAVRRLFDAPYHRAAFLQPGTFDFGAGVQEQTTTLLLGTSDEAAVVTYPADNQKNAPLSWDGIETPNPLRMHHRSAADGALGYPITLFSFGTFDDEAPRLSHVSAALFTVADNKPVTVFVNSADNDPFLTNGVLLIPAKPLRPLTAYRVSVQAADAGGRPVSRTWTFTTAAQ